MKRYSNPMSILLAFKSQSYFLVLSQCFAILSKKDKRKLSTIASLQVLLSVVDLLGIALLGLLASISIRGLGSFSPGNRTSQILDFLHLGNFSFQTQSFIIGISAVSIMTARTLASIFFTRRTLFFMSRRGAQITGTLFAKILSQDFKKIQKHGIQEYMYSLTFGVEVITLRILAQFVTLASDVSLVVIMSIGVLYIDPIIAISTLLIISAVSILLYKLMHTRANNLGLLNSKIDIRSREIITEALTGFREIYVKNRQQFYIDSVYSARAKIAEIIAENNFMPYMSKYVIETTVVISAMVLSAIQFALNDAAHAVSTLAIFLAAGTRVAPSILRLQQGAIQIKSAMGTASTTLDLISSLQALPDVNNKSTIFKINHENFVPKVELRTINLSYENRTNLALEKITLSIEPGSVVAIVGPSGAGKTSLIDVLLGVINPDNGEVTISGETPASAISKWPGAIAYVPQDITISNGSLRENITFGFLDREIPDNYIWESIKIAQLNEFVKGLPDGLDSQIGDKGGRMSGGQRQRLGIARALLTKPKLIILDEATSALDGQTELQIGDAINKLKGESTVILIAHRLSTARSADEVVYMENGKILSRGTFESVRRIIPDFDKQAKLMGL